MNNQILTVLYKSKHASNAKLSYFQKVQGIWTNPIKNVDAICGKNGFSNTKIEGDMTTPIGVFDIPFAFGTTDEKNLKIKYINVVNHVWVDDASSIYYNTIQEKNNNLLWYSSEQLNLPVYKYSLVVGYNTIKPKPNKGSAIFVHCKGTCPYTAGCIAIDEYVLKDIISLLNISEKPIIIIDSLDNINKIKEKVGVIFEE